MSPLVQKLAEQLQRLERQVRAHDARLTERDKKWLTQHSAFHDQLFEHQGMGFDGYLQVLKKDLRQIQQFEQVNARADSLELVCQRFANRFAALSQAIANSAVMHKGADISAKATALRIAKWRAQKDAKVKQAQEKTQQTQMDEFHWIAKATLSSSHQLYAELNQHHEWVTRFEDQIRQLEQSLGSQQGTDKINLQNKILDTHRRLGRCRRAISYIEERIEYLEKPKRRN